MISTRRQRKQNVKRLAIGSTIAAVVGYFAGLLTAPQSGKDTREDIKETANKGLTEAEKDLKRAHTELGKALDEAKKSTDKLSAKTQKQRDELVTAAKDTKEKVREVLSAIHEGDANDKDLAGAVKDANTALKHLRDYLKK